MEGELAMKFLFIVFVLFYPASTSQTDVEGINWMNRTDTLNGDFNKTNENSSQSESSNESNYIYHGSSVIVLDTSSAMNDIRPEILKFLEELQNDSYYDYALIKFNETDAQISIPATKNMSQLGENLNQLKSNNATGCERKSLSGIQQGLQIISPESYMIVFTNGIPIQTDLQLLPEILSTIAIKHTRVFFIFIKKCQEISDLYQQIASSSNGQIIEIDDNEIIQYLKPLVNSQRVDLLAIDNLFDTGTAQNSEKEIFVDETITEILISIYSDQAIALEVTVPGDEPKNLRDISCNSTLNSSTVYVCSIQDPPSGSWKMLVKDFEKKYSLRVYAESNMTFNFGFTDSVEVLSATDNKMYCQPPTDYETIHFLVSIDDSWSNASVSSANIISLNGEEMDPFQLKRVNQTTNLFFGKFDSETTNGSSFHFQINGTTNGDSKFQRITPVAFGNYFGNGMKQEKICKLHNISYVEGTAPSVNQSSNPSTEKEVTPTKNPPTKNSDVVLPTIILTIVVAVVIVALAIIVIMTYSYSRAGSYDVGIQEIIRTSSRPCSHME